MAKHSLLIITKIFALVIILLTLINCSKPGTANNQSIQLTYEMQSATSEGIFITSGESMDLFYHDDYVLYKRPYVAMETLFRELDTNGVAREPIKEPFNYYYLIAKNNAKWAYRFDSINVTRAKRLSIDTFRNENTFQGLTFFLKDREVLISKNVSADKNLLLEKYLFTGEKGDYDADTTFYYFDKRLVNLKYSFSKYLDSIKHSKLVKVVMVYRKRHIGEMYEGRKLTFNIPRSIYRFEIKKNEAPESKEITDFINRFKSKESTLYPDK